MFDTMMLPHIKCGIGSANMKVYVNLLVLFIMCGLSNAKYINVNENVPVNVIKEDVQDSIQNLLRTGIYSHRHLDPSNVEIVTPIKVSREGSLVSRAVDHSHEHGHARARRDLTGREHKLEHSLHYNLTVGGRHLRLDLRPSVSFIIPAMIVERHSASGRTRDRPHPDSTGCHYTGSIRGQGSSTVALSACDGLAGLLRTEHGEYWIEPSNEIPTEESQGRPHVIFKRSAVSKEAAFYRSKRSIDNKDIKNNNLRKDWYNKETQQYSRHYNSRNYHGNRNVMDPRRREILENRAKRLELLRRNPYEYRKRLDEQKQSQSSSISNSVESSSLEELKKKNITKFSSEAERNRIIEKVSRWKNEERKRRMKLHKRRRRRTKNCGTKQPRYQWRKRNEKRESEIISHQKNIEENKILHRKIGEMNRRSARSISKPRHVEVLLVADKSMTEFHDKGNLEMYLLTIMNLVSSLYMDPTIGNYIKIVVVKIIIIDEDDPSSNLSVTPNADKTLSSFCRWQQRLNPEDDENPHHHDVAILVTRQDICSQNDTPCSTLGVAHVAGMCKPDRSCSVNEDNGITLAHTITHELGHNFGLYHDTEKIGCNRRDGSTLHIMTPIFEADTAQVAWSRCSKRDVTNFLDSGMGECLGDAPSKKEYEYPSTPAGMIFDAATQCHLQFGSEAAVCAEPAELCEHLWCVVNNTCKTMLRPAAPGTVCGPDMWCQNQRCVGRTASPSPTDGGWGSWGAWSECSRSCGAGVSTQRRECDSPEPSHNGRYCIGERSRYKICNTDPCSITEPSFRDVQCSKFDNKPYRNKTFDKWVPYFDQDKPCELICVARDRPDEEQQDGFVADGTPCRQNLGSRDLCIAGVCHHVGCDWEVGSMMEEDACGVCGGDGSLCRTVQGLYTKGTTTQTGFSEVAIIPAGSRNVKIEEKVNPGNYIAIGSANKKKVYMRGARNITQTEYLVAGSPAMYERDRDWEKVRIPGPLTEDIKVYQRIYRGKRRNPGVTYQYTVERAAHAPAPDSDRRWAPSAWGPCSVTCGAGTHARTVTCRDRQQVEVEQSECYHLESPNIVLMRECRLPACPSPSRSHPRTHALAQYRSTLQRQRRLQQRARLTSATYWWFGAWNKCTHSCNVPGRPATRTRDVYCVDRVKNKVIDDSSCTHTRKPPRSVACNDLPPC